MNLTNVGMLVVSSSVLIVVSTILGCQLNSLLDVFVRRVRRRLAHKLDRQ